MKTLIIHPEDKSTDFLAPIYENIFPKTVIRKDTLDVEVRAEIKSHDQIIMLGHGTPSGLMNVSRIGTGAFSINHTHVDLLRDKHCIFIWCDADQFVQKHKLRGLFTGMFVSEDRELFFCKEGRPAEIDPSNSLFAETLGRCLVEHKADYQSAFAGVDLSYGELARENKVAAYNHSRWYARLSKDGNVYLK